MLTSPVARQFHVLAVDDQPVNLRLLEAALGHHGYRVSTADDGQSALALLTGDSGAASAAPIDLVLMDCQMPGMDGLEAVRRWRQWEQGHAGGVRLPIIALSAATLTDEGDRCLQAGMDGFVAKPFRLPHLLGVIATRLGAPVPAPAPPRVSTPGKAVLDLDGALERVDGDARLLHALLAMVPRQAQGDCVAIDAALGAADLVELGRALHRLRGLLVTVGAERSAALCAVLEKQAARVLADPDGGVACTLPPLWDILQSELRQLEAAISAVPPLIYPS